MLSHVQQNLTELVVDRSQLDAQVYNPSSCTAGSIYINI